MNLEDYITEVQLGHDSSLSNIFNVALGQVFSEKYLKKINSVLINNIKLKYINHLNKQMYAYNKGSNIYVNQEPFNALGPKQQIRTLLHEFVHVLQRKRKFFLFKEFKEISNLSKILGEIVKEDLVKPYPVFLTGRNANIGSGGDYEILAYLMSDTIDWSALTLRGREEFKEAIRKSGIFNLNHQFWIKRLN